MSPDPVGSQNGSVRRRAVLGAVTAAMGTAGCVRSAASVLGRDAPERASVHVRTVPADDDPAALLIARFLARQLEAVGVRAQVTPMRSEALLRAVLSNQDFDVYVAKHPGSADPDFLYPLFHSRFAEEAGWQNPTGYANLEVDDWLDAQRRERGPARQRTLERVQGAVLRDQPLTVIAFPHALGAVRTDRVNRRSPLRLLTPLDFLRLEPASTASSAGSSPGGSSAAESTTLRVALTDPRPTENLNPLAVEFRAAGTVTGLLYDPLGRRRGDAVVPWLADGWEWERSDGGSLRADVTLREGLRWHDGRALTADDIAFTYRFLRDTSLGRQDSPIPAPRFRGPSSLVRSVEAPDPTTARFDLGPVSAAVAADAFTVPVLPAHVWTRRARQATIAGLDARRTVTEALVWNNLAPVGSGPLRVESVSPRTGITLARFDDHVLHRGAAEIPVAGIGFAFDRLRFVVAPTGASGVRLLVEGAVDAVPTGVEPASIPQIGGTRAVQLVVEPTRSFYHLGFNVRRRPFSNPRFRRAVARLLDKEHLVDAVLDGYGDPAASPLAGLPAVAPGARWDGEDPELPFPGRAGVVDVERAKAAFEAAGYRYSNDGRLLLN